MIYEGEGCPDPSCPPLDPPILIFVGSSTCLGNKLVIDPLAPMQYSTIIESTNIDQGGADVIIGIHRSTAHHVQCLNSQQFLKQNGIDCQIWNVITSPQRHSRTQRFR